MSVVPDSITPEVGWRAWNISRDGYLTSLNNPIFWPIGSPLVASCTHGPAVEYVPRRHGRIVPEGYVIDLTPMGPHRALKERNYLYNVRPHMDVKINNLPCVQLPPGWGYEMEPVQRVVPDEQCSCGIYALRSKEAMLSSPFSRDKPVLGAVSLWGKVIPGENGFRAQYAYPLFLFTDKKVAGYGVPVSPYKDIHNDENRT